MAQRSIDAATVLAAGVLVVAPWVGYASVRSHSLVPVVETDATTLLVGTYLPGDGRTTGFKRALAGETRARFPSCRAAATSGFPARPSWRRCARAAGARLPGGAARRGARQRAPLRARAPDGVRRDDGPQDRPDVGAAESGPIAVGGRGHAVVVVLALAGLLCGALWDGAETWPS